jgi:LAS superfamily LD-carboxypeptidase LdcB
MSLLGIFPAIAISASRKFNLHGRTFRTIPGEETLLTIKLPDIDELPDPLLVRIIDKSHPISEEEINNLVVPNLILLPLKLEGIRTANENVRIHSVMLTDLERLFEQANADRTGLFIHSGFRTYEQQAITYSQANDKLVVLKPGASQHHSGLAVDFTSSDIGKLIDINLSFETTKAGLWLIDNASQYGFIRSYTSSHDDIKDEPWHYLYIGRELADSYSRLKTAGWYGDAFLLQYAVNLGMRQIVIDETNP